MTRWRIRSAGARGRLHRAILLFGDVMLCLLSRPFAFAACTMLVAAVTVGLRDIAVVGHATLPTPSRRCSQLFRNAGTRSTVDCRHCSCSGMVSLSSVARQRSRYCTPHVCCNCDGVACVNRRYGTQVMLSIRLLSSPALLFHGRPPSPSVRPPPPPTSSSLSSCSPSSRNLPHPPPSRCSSSAS